MVHKDVIPNGSRASIPTLFTALRGASPARLTNSCLNPLAAEVGRVSGVHMFRQFLFQHVAAAERAEDQVT